MHNYVYLGTLQLLYSSDGTLEHKKDELLMHIIYGCFVGILTTGLYLLIYVF